MSSLFRRMLALLFIALFAVACGNGPTDPDDDDDDDNKGGGPLPSASNNLVYVHGVVTGESAKDPALLATLDVKTGALRVIGPAGMLISDIAMDSSGTLFGTNGYQLVRFNTTTGAATVFGAPFPFEASAANALTFASNGTLYMASGFNFNFFTVNPTTGATTLIGTIPVGFSSGDLAFHDGQLYYSVNGGNSDILMRVNLANPAASTFVGQMGIPRVFGLISKGGVLYGVSGTSIYTINTTTAAATNPVSFAGKGIIDSGGLALRFR